MIIHVHVHLKMKEKLYKHKLENSLSEIFIVFIWKFTGMAVKYKITNIANIFFHLFIEDSFIEVNNITESFWVLDILILKRVYVI
jgi:hypothetical protein